MATKEVLDQYLDSFSGLMKKLKAKDVAKLESAINMSEEVVGIVECTPGLLAATSERLIHIGGISINSYPYKRIDSIISQKSFIGSGIFIVTGGKKEWVPGIPKAKIDDFNNLINKQIASAGQDATIRASSGSNDVLDQLEKLGKLKDQGVLSEEEFQQQKNKILQ